MRMPRPGSETVDMWLHSGPVVLICVTGTGAGGLELGDRSEAHPAQPESLGSLLLEHGEHSGSAAITGPGQSSCISS